MGRRDVPGAADRIVSVEISGQLYPIRCTLDPDYVADLARFVDTRMRDALEQSPTGDTLKLAVIAALNIADELFHCRQADEHSVAELVSRAGRLEALVDGALARAETHDASPPAARPLESL